MTSVILSAILSMGLLPAAAGDLPLQVPEGWDSRKQEGSLLMVPKNMPEGKFYTVVVVPVAAKVGSLKGLTEAAKATLGQTGTFKPARDPAAAKNEAGWEFETLVGTLEKDGNALMAQSVVLRKDAEEGIILVFSDSVETMQKYSDAFSGMIKSVGVPKVPPPVAGAGKVDLKYKVPEGWTSVEKNGTVLLESVKNTFYEKWTFRLLILPSEPLEQDLRKTFLARWATEIKPNFVTSIVPLPLVRRMKSGAACGFDLERTAKNKTGEEVNAGLYVLARGSRYVPILAIFYGFDSGLEKSVEEFLESAEIPGAGTEKVALYSPADLHGTWDTSSSSIAAYVTGTGGSFVEGISVGTGVVFNADGTFKKTLSAIQGIRQIKETDEGKWKADDAELTLRESKYWVLGVGSDPKAGAFLVLNNYANQEDRLRLTYPRAASSGTWYKRKE
jgi:hypothetical protein